MYPLAFGPSPDSPRMMLDSREERRECQGKLKDYGLITFALSAVRRG
jgi:hypothetical protein